MNGDIRTFSMLDIPPVRCRIATINKCQTVPFQDKTYCSIDSMDGGKASDDYTILIKDDLVVPVIRELVDLKLTAPEIDESCSRSDVQTYISCIRSIAY